MKRFGSIAALALILAIFFGINILAAAALRPVRVDLTQDRLYTLSEGSRSIARSLPGPVKLTMYYSAAASDGLPQIKAYAARVRELLEGYARESGGNITLEVVDPEPFTDAEDRAVAAGLAAMPVGGPGAPTLYFGLVATNDTDGQKVIPFFDPGGEQFLEYEVSRAIHALGNPDKSAIAVISMLPLDGGMEIDPRTGQPMPGRPWQIIGLLRELFEVTMLAPDITEIPEGTDALLVVHPKNLPAGVLFAIDQYVLGGGRALVFVDPYCEADIPPGGFQDQMQMLMAPRASDMPELFSAWGIRLAQERLAGDLERGMSVMVARGAEPITYIAWLALQKDNLDAGDAVTGQLGAITMGTAGILEPIEGASTRITPLLSTSTQAMSIGVEKIRFQPDPRDLLATFVSGDAKLTLGARITGPVKSAFPGGRPPPEPGPDGAISEPPGEPAPALAESTGDINVIIIADADMLTDRFWIEEQTVGPISLGFRKTADNGDLVVQAMDNLSGSSDLIAMRARGRFSRPFTLVEKIQKAAEVQYLAEQSALEARLRETESRLGELQRQRADGPDGQADGGMILTPEQQAELERFRKEMLDTRKQLRAVQANMNKDIQALGTKLKWANIALVPAGVTLAAVGMAAYRASRRGKSEQPRMNADKTETQ